MLLSRRGFLAALVGVLAVPRGAAGDACTTARRYEHVEYGFGWTNRLWTTPSVAPDRLYFSQLYEPHDWPLLEEPVTYAVRDDGVYRNGVRISRDPDAWLRDVPPTG